METLRIGFATLGLLAASTATGAPFMPFGAGDGSLRLLDPALPLTDANPITVDTGLSAADLETPITLFAATIDGTEARNIRQPRLAYVKGGQVFVVNLTPTGSHAPTRLSTLTDACEIDGGREDFSDVTKSWLKISRRGPDGNCDSDFDNVTTAVKLNAGPSATGITPAGMRTFDALRDPSTGAIVGFLTVEGNNPVTLKRRSSLMTTPTQIVNLASGNREKYERVLGDYFFKLTRLGDPQPGLFRYQQSTGQLHGPLHLYTSNEFGGLDHAVHDANHLFFGDGNQVWRVPLGATDAAQTQRLTTVAAGQVVSRIHRAPGSARVVFQTRNQANGTGGIFSVPATAADATATTLKAPAFGVGVELMAAGGDFAYFTTFGFTAGTISSTRINVDGTSPLTNNNTYWAGLVIPTRFDFVATGSPEMTPAFLIKGVRNGDGSDTLRLVNPVTGLIGKTMGTIANVARGPAPGVFAFGVGRYVGAGAVRVRGTNPDDTDAFRFDTLTANSLVPVLETVGSDDHVYFGGG